MTSTGQPRRRGTSVHLCTSSPCEEYIAGDRRDDDTCIRCDLPADEHDLDTGTASPDTASEETTTP